jgi:hypothetical protein
VFEIRENYRMRRVKCRPIEILVNWYKIRYTRSALREGKSFRFMELAEGFEPPTL